jgi:hypothetical protein
MSSGLHSDSWHFKDIGVRRLPGPTSSLCGCSFLVRNLEEPNVEVFAFETRYAPQQLKRHAIAALAAWRKFLRSQEGNFMCRAMIPMMDAIDSADGNGFARIR